MSLLSWVRSRTVRAGLQHSMALPDVNSANPGTRHRDRMRLFTRETGNALVEFAFVLPMMMVVITGLYSFGVTLSNQIALTQATGAGAQYLITLRGNTTDPCADTLTAIQSAAPNLNTSALNLTLTMNGVAVSGNSCAGQSSSLMQGQAVTVATTYPCSLLIYGLNLGSGCQLAAQVTEFEY
jgi:Flp pilus assembly protein TadG